MLNNILVTLCPIAISVFFSISKISLVASRRIKLKLLASEGSANVRHMLKMQENPDTSFTIMQIGLSAVTVLSGIVDDTALSSTLHSLLGGYMSPKLSKQSSFITSFILVTSLLVLFADLTPKCIGVIAPEAVALHIVNPVCFCPLVFHPLVQLLGGMANMIFRIFRLPVMRKDNITSDDIYAVIEADMLARVLCKQEHEPVEDIFELESRTIPSSMTLHEDIIWFDLHEDEQSLKNKVAEHPHSKSPACNGDIDHIIGHINSKDLLDRVLISQSLVLISDVQIRNALIMPDTLTLLEALGSFKAIGKDFAVVINEYVLVVGIITLSDVMITPMGDPVGQGLRKWVVAHDESSWLIDGGMPTDGMMRVLDIGELPQFESYETIGDLMVFVLRKIPKRIDTTKFSGYRFEIVDIDDYRTDQLLVTHIDNKPTALVSRQAEVAKNQNT